MKNKQTAVDHSGNNTVLRIKEGGTFERGHFYKYNYYFLGFTLFYSMCTYSVSI